MRTGVRVRGGRLDLGDQFEIILEPFGRRQEDRDMVAARLDRHRGAHRPLDDLLLLAFLGRGGTRRATASERCAASAAIGSAGLGAKSGSGPRGSVVS
jgi:hypothetical protein